jgi:hypothetical protein
MVGSSLSAAFTGIATIIRSAAFIALQAANFIHRSKFSALFWLSSLASTPIIWDANFFSFNVNAIEPPIKPIPMTQLSS